MERESKEKKVPSDVCELLSKWIRSATTYGTAHSKEAIVLARRHRRIGAPSVTLSALVGTSIFAAIQEVAESSEVKWLLASLSMAAACLTALVTFYNYAEKGTRHKIASEEYMDIARRLEILTTSIAKMLPHDWRNVLEGYSQRLEAIGGRVDLPSTMEIDELLTEKGYGMFPDPGQGTRGEPVKHPIIMREGFPLELERVYMFVSGKRGNEMADSPNKANAADS